MRSTVVRNPNQWCTQLAHTLKEGNILARMVEKMLLQKETCTKGSIDMSHGGVDANCHGCWSDSLQVQESLFSDELQLSLTWKMEILLLKNTLITNRFYRTKLINWPDLISRHLSSLKPEKALSKNDQSRDFQWSSITTMDQPDFQAIHQLIYIFNFNFNITFEEILFNSSIFY